MSCLAINLAPPLRSQLQSQLPMPLIAATGLDEALSQLELLDFSHIVNDVRQQLQADQDLSQLLAHTPPGTRIVAIGSVNTLPDMDYWQSQGLIILYEPDISCLCRFLLDQG